MNLLDIGQKMGGRGQCEYCGVWIDNVAEHEANYCKHRPSTPPLDIKTCPKDNDGNILCEDETGAIRKVIILQDMMGDYLCEPSSQQTWLMNGRWLRVKHANLVRPAPVNELFVPSKIIASSDDPVLNLAPKLEAIFKVPMVVQFVVACQDAGAIQSFLADEFKNWLSHETGREVSEVIAIDNRRVI